MRIPNLGLAGGLGGIAHNALKIAASVTPAGRAGKLVEMAMRKITNFANPHYVSKMLQQAARKGGPLSSQAGSAARASFNGLLGAGRQVASAVAARAPALGELAAGALDTAKAAPGDAGERAPVHESIRGMVGKEMQKLATSMGPEAEKLAKGLESLHKYTGKAREVLDAFIEMGHNNSVELVGGTPTPPQSPEPAADHAGPPDATADAKPEAKPDGATAAAGDVETPDAAVPKSATTTAPAALAPAPASTTPAPTASGSPL